MFETGKDGYVRTQEMFGCLYRSGCITLALSFVTVSLQLSTIDVKPMMCPIAVSGMVCSFPTRLIGSGWGT